MCVRRVVAQLAVIATMILSPLVIPAHAECVGDLDGDLDIDIADLAELLGSYGETSGMVYENGDLDGDGDVDIFDLAALLGVYGETCVPEGMAYVPGGEFELGDSLSEGDADEQPVHEVYISPCFVDKHEVTNQQYADALNWAWNQGGLITVKAGVVFQYYGVPDYPYCSTDVNDSDSSILWTGTTFMVEAGRENQPMVEVSWYGAVAYSNWRSAMEDRSPSYDIESWECDFEVNGYRLPTEAEWEKAARGGVAGHRFAWSDVDTIQHARANYYSSPDYFYDTSPTRGYHPDFDDDGDPYTSPVGCFAPNGYGLYDMTGNVYEWCNDWYDPSYYDFSTSDNPKGPSQGTKRVRRGGGWYSSATSCRCAVRDDKLPSYLVSICGFRLVLDFE